jgi:hypothetical protein
LTRLRALAASGLLLLIVAALTLCPVSVASKGSGARSAPLRRCVAHPSQLSGRVSWHRLTMKRSPLRVRWMSWQVTLGQQATLAPGRERWT